MLLKNCELNKSQNNLNESSIKLSEQISEQDIKKLFEDLVIYIFKTIKSKNISDLDVTKYIDIDNFLKDNSILFEKYSQKEQKERVLKVRKWIVYGDYSKHLQCRTRIVKILYEEFDKDDFQIIQKTLIIDELESLLYDCEISFIDSDVNAEHEFKNKVKTLINDYDFYVSESALCKIVNLGKEISINSKEFALCAISIEFEHDYIINKKRANNFVHIFFKYTIGDFCNEIISTFIKDAGINVDKHLQDFILNFVNFSLNKINDYQLEVKVNELANMIGVNKVKDKAKYEAINLALFNIKSVCGPMSSLNKKLDISFSGHGDIGYLFDGIENN
ncbi:hypothetical protein AB837_00524 [bacterium AB1]|nr:hypothetical protein AB837_00524 [bacterium AB1]